MLVATRDPMPHQGTHDDTSSRHRGGGGAPRVARLMTVLQLAGSLLAIPVGLASAYSIYRANFSVETTCQTLRANIISMIDKQVDAGTRRMLVRRDVEAFEKSCGGVDPDAEAAFRTLLAADKAPLAAAPAKDVARKAEPRPSVAARQSEKQPAAATPAPAIAAVEPAKRDAPMSDARWLDAVRGALVAHDPEQAKAPAEASARVATPATAVRPAAPETRPMPAESAPPAQPVQPAPIVAAPTVAPALPPATSVAAAPRPDDHPVPPAAIPEAAPSDGRADDSRFGWVKHIPFVGQALVR